MWWLVDAAADDDNVVGVVYVAGVRVIAFVVVVLVTLYWYCSCNCHWYGQ